MIYRNIVLGLALVIVFVVSPHAQEKITTPSNSPTPFTVGPRQSQMMCGSNEQMQEFLQGMDYELIGIGVEPQMGGAQKLLLISKLEKTVLSVVITREKACMTELTQNFKINEHWARKLSGNHI